MKRLVGIPIAQKCINISLWSLIKFSTKTFSTQIDTNIHTTPRLVYVLLFAITEKKKHLEIYFCILFKFQASNIWIAVLPALAIQIWLMCSDISSFDGILDLIILLQAILRKYEINNNNKGSKNQKWNRITVIKVVIIRRFWIELQHLIALRWNKSLTVFYRKAQWFED